VAKKGRRSDGSDRPIVVASNRLPFTFSRTARGLERKRSPGGLVSAMEPVLRKRGGTWVGWPGIELKKGESLPTQGEPYRIEPVLVTDSEQSRYYHGFSNRTLWPVFHTMPTRAKFENKDWEAYVRVNSRFARSIVGEAADAGVVWVHDYHLLLTLPIIRQALPGTRLAFFLHIPFPPFDVFRLLPWDREILRAMLASDLIGFHVRGYVQNFMDCVERSLGARVDRELGLVEYGDRTTRIDSFPLGIEFEAYESLALAAPPSADTGSSQIVLGVDRLDYTKGIPDRLRGFERLFELHPEHREKVTLIQLAVPSRSQVSEYRALKREIDEMVGRINGRFATASWSPIRYLYRTLSQQRLAALYRDADVALVTPIRDGMNLVAKEFIACQVGDPGVLILSRLAGAADTMRESLLVNPVDVDGTAEALHRALTMDEHERRSRVTALRRRERRDDVDAWVARFLDEASGARAALDPLSGQDLDAWLSPFLKRYQLALFLDYDGTLTPLRDHPAKAKLGTPMRRALQACIEREDTDVAIVSGRALDDVRGFAPNERITFAGNHGLEISGPGMEPFIHEDLVHFRARSEALADTLEVVAADGAWVERKGPTLTYHFRAVPENAREAMVAEAREIIAEAGYLPRDAHCAVEARPPIGWDKGRAVLHILRTRYGQAWSERVRVVYVGDDQTDEDAFRFLSGLAMTFRVGSADTPTSAARRLPDVAAVRVLLEWLAQRTVGRA
jgi:trehalose 6-phosphate synthase/phosphatase